jgi:hypothetical protein
MIIKIDLKTDIEKEKIFTHIKRFCIENFQEFELNIDELTYKQEKKHETT